VGELVAVGEIPGKTGKETPGKKGDELEFFGLGLVIRGLTVPALGCWADNWAEVLGAATHPLPNPPNKNTVTLRIGKFLIGTKLNLLKRLLIILSLALRRFILRQFFNVGDRQS
jgi:hypothetical protein